MPSKGLITTPARAAFSPAQVTLIRDTVAKDCSEPELHYFLEVAAYYELSPFVGEIYAAKMTSKNGGGGRVVIFVGRNGWLKMARRHDDFIRMEAEAVRQNDVFKVRRNASGSRTVTHTYVGGNVKRGPLIGAWAMIHRKGTEPTYAWAAIEEYQPESPNAFSPWLKQQTVMIKKCALVVALRETYNLSGLYDEAERESIGPSIPAGTVSTEVDFGEDEAGERIKLLVQIATSLDDTMFRPAKLRAKLNGASPEDRLRFMGEVEEFIVAHGGELPPLDIPEAEVVE